ncbi:MAG: penicillin-binding protein [Myxococcales bacterium]|nr:penicillin-binding protein [Myxococcales bacterium]
MAVGVGAPLVVALAFASLSRSPVRAEGSHELPSISKLVSVTGAAASAPPHATLAGLELAKLTVGDTGATAPLPEKRVAHLTVDPALQRAADGVMSMHHVPEASVVLMDVQTGKILVYASHVEKGPQRDLCVEATAPAASVFKIITASALVEQAGATPDQRECYSGGEQRIVEKDLVPDLKRDRWCTTLAGAMGRSINTVFARLALHHLKPAGLEAQAKALGFGSALPFDVPVQPSAEHFPEDQLGFARTAAGFWNTTLSPLHAAWLSATMARGGEPVRPVLVADVADEAGKVVWTADTSLAQKRVIKERTAAAVTSMMESTVTDGTSYRAFHDPKGAAFLPNIGVAGKTGTLTDPTNQRFYTWFTGFAPSRPIVIADGDSPANPPPRQVAIGVLVVNNPTWSIKANLLAREVLRAYFAQQKVPNVTSPQLHSAPPKEAGAAGEDDAQPAPPQRGVSTTPGTKHRRQRGS